MNVPKNLIVEWNNEAVSYLQEGNYRAAVGCLERALEQLEVQIFYESNIKRETYDSTFEVPFLRVTSVAIAPSPKAEASSNIFRFYRRAFRVSSYSGAPWTIKNWIRNAIVIKYNMAIAYHDDGIRRDRMSHLLKAMDLYQEILFIMDENGIKGHTLLLMALSNNMGWIHSHCLNFDQTRESLYWVRKLALACRDYHTTVPYHEYKFFYETVRIFATNDLTVAPAA
jgi:tetratricopeptide (TPR) repeat protein